MSRFAIVGLACLVLFLLPTLFAADNGNMTSDAVYATNTYADLSFTELESYFSATNPSGSPAAKNVIFSLPLGWTKDTPEFQELITVLDELHNNGSIFYDVHAVYEYDDVSCNDYWDLEDGTLIIIGNISNNRLFSCYHNENYEIGEGLMALDRNLWADKSEVALLVNDVGLENVIKILETGEYKNLEGTTYNILFWTNKARGYINVLPVAGLAINFFITDTIEDLVLTGDSCVHSFDGDAAAIDCAVSLGVSAVDYVTFKTFSKSGVGKGAKKLAREAVEDTVDVAEYVAFSNKVKLITRSKYSKELSEYFNSCLLYEGFTSAGYESQSTKRCLYEPDINLMAKEDIEVLEKYLKKSQDGFGTGENKVIALFSTKKADFSFSVVADDFQISEASVLRFGNKNVGYQHFKKHIEVPEDFTKKKPKTTFIRVINGEERYMTTQDVMDRIAYAFKNGKEDEQLSTEKTLVIRTYDKDSYSKYREYLTVIIRESGEVLTTYPDHKTTR
ncbi:MAG: hypothetical protein H6500_04575 [Candidatus Woesearchaeota archaeon]|nr:MAG: hypothetical protein H6500_04575 [Candidatus Woesearchaeota archaeon]